MARTSRHAVADALLPALLAVAAVVVLGMPAPVVLVWVGLLLGVWLGLGGRG